MAETNSRRPMPSESAGEQGPDITETSERLRALLAASTPGPWALASWDPKLALPVAWAADQDEAADRGPFGVIHGSEADAALVAEALTALPRLLDEIDRLRAESDELHGDVLRAITERNEVAERAASEFCPGPDGQDHIDRQALIQRWLDDGRDEAETWRTSWQKASERAVAAEAEVERLRTLVERLSWGGLTMDFLDAFDRVISAYAPCDADLEVLTNGASEWLSIREYVDRVRDQRDREAQRRSAALATPDTEGEG